MKLSCNTGLSGASNFCCGKSELKKLQTPLTSTVLFLRFNLAVTTSARPLQGRGQAQQEPNSAKGPVVEAEQEENPSAGEVGVLEEARRAATGEAKINSAESSCGSVSDSRRPLDGVGSPPSSDWKDNG